MYDSLLLLIVMLAGILTGRTFSRAADICRWIQGAAVMVLLFSMGVSMRSFTNAESGLEIWLKGAAIAMAALAGSVAMARLYRSTFHKGGDL